VPDGVGIEAAAMEKPLAPYGGNGEGTSMLA
jgi:hypothetical protein